MTTVATVSTEEEPLWVRIINRITLISAIPACICVFLMMVHITVDVVARTFFNSPTQGAYEIISFYWMPIISFSCLALAQLRGEQVRATMVTDLLPDGLRKFADFFALALLFLYGLLFTWYGWKAALDSMELRELMAASIELPVWPVRFVVPFGGAILCLQIIAEIPKTMRGTSHDEISEVL